jgi:hypothetical protein
MKKFTVENVLNQSSSFIDQARRLNLQERKDGLFFLHTTFRLSKEWEEYGLSYQNNLPYLPNISEEEFEETLYGVNNKERSRKKHIDRFKELLEGEFLTTPYIGSYTTNEEWDNVLKRIEEFPGKIEEFKKSEEYAKRIQLVNSYNEFDNSLTVSENGNILTITYEDSTSSKHSLVEKDFSVEERLSRSLAKNSLKNEIEELNELQINKFGNLPNLPFYNNGVNLIWNRTFLAEIKKEGSKKDSHSIDPDMSRYDSWGGNFCTTDEYEISSEGIDIIKKLILEA